MVLAHDQACSYWIAFNLMKRLRTLTITFPHMLTLMDCFRPRKVTTWVLVYVESEFERLNTRFLHLDTDN